jgi:hypothetical protein
VAFDGCTVCIRKYIWTIEPWNFILQDVIRFDLRISSENIQDSKQEKYMTEKVLMPIQSIQM